MLYNMYICHIYLLYSMVYNRLYNTKFLVLAGVGASRAFQDRKTGQDAPASARHTEGIRQGHNSSIKHPTAGEVKCQFIYISNVI